MIVIVILIVMFLSIILILRYSFISFKTVCNLSVCVLLLKMCCLLFFELYTFVLDSADCLSQMRTQALCEFGMIVVVVCLVIVIVGKMLCTLEFNLFFFFSLLHIQNMLVRFKLFLFREGIAPQKELGLI